MTVGEEPNASFLTAQVPPLRRICWEPVEDATSVATCEVPLGTSKRPPLTASRLLRVAASVVDSSKRVPILKALLTGSVPVEPVTESRPLLTISSSISSEPFWLAPRRR